MNDNPSIWQQITRRTAEFVGGTLIDDGGDAFDRAFGVLPDSSVHTTIVAISFEDDYFSVEGATFTCGGHASVLGVVGCRHTVACPAIHLKGYAGHRWSILPKGSTTP